jgi:REP element-mobilizing transposase RayT
MTTIPRQLRVEFPGAIYHLMSRGDRREDIFLNDVDRHDFLKTLAEACQKTGWQLHAYCLMRKHFGRGYPSNHQTQKEFVVI